VRTTARCSFCASSVAPRGNAVIGRCLHSAKSGGSVQIGALSRAGFMPTGGPHRRGDSLLRVTPTGGEEAPGALIPRMDGRD
jgi:hypothetical protein